MNGWESVSVLIIALNEADRIAPALDSIPAGAQRIVADGGSRDNTVAVARDRGALVVPQDEEAIRAARGNFDVARDAAARRYARRPWILYLDADERISPKLAAEIPARLGDPAPAAYDMPRLNLYWGRPVRLLGEDRQVRLFRAGQGAYPGRELHEKVAVNGPIAHLAGALIHENVRCWKELRQRMRRYIPLEAQTLSRRHTRGEVLRAFDRRFAYYYLAQGAWRDGWRGLAVSAAYAWQHAAALWEARKRHV